MKVHPAGGSWRGPRPGLEVPKEGQGGKVYWGGGLFLWMYMGLLWGVGRDIVATDGIREETIPLSF